MILLSNGSVCVGVGGALALSSHQDTGVAASGFPSSLLCGIECKVLLLDPCPLAAGLHHEVVRQTSLLVYEPIQLVQLALHPHAINLTC